MSNEQFFREAFFLPPALIAYHISQSLKQLFPQKGYIEIEGGPFDVASYADAQLCLLTQKSFIHNQMMTYWLQPGPEVMRNSGPGPHRMHHDGAALRTRRSRRGEEPGKHEQETIDRAIVVAQLSCPHGLEVSFALCAFMLCNSVYLCYAGLDVIR